MPIHLPGANEVAPLKRTVPRPAGISTMVPNGRSMGIQAGMGHWSKGERAIERHKLWFLPSSSLPALASNQPIDLPSLHLMYSLAFDVVYALWARLFRTLLSLLSSTLS
jgi:hypothetical protein